MSAAFSSLTLGTLHAPEILNALPDGVYITDTDRKIIFWNHAAERITGWDPSEVIGRNCSDNILVHVDKDGHKLCGEEYCPLHRSIVTGMPSGQALLVYAQHRSGRRVPVEVSVSPIRDSGGQIVGGIELFRDLSLSVEDMIRAKLIQSSELASTVPADNRVAFDVRYTPNDIVGGDFYRIERLDNDTYGILVADVMGHGVAAALYTMQLRSLWEDGRQDLNSPSKFLMKMNHRLHILAGDAGYFATAVYATLNASSGDLLYARAGHPPPLLIHDGGSTTPLDNPQPSLGMLADFEYEDNTAHMDCGESLMLYTDGAIEIEGKNGTELGVEGLSNLLRDPTLRSPARLEEQLLTYSSSIHLPDDLTLLCVTRFL